MKTDITKIVFAFRDAICSSWNDVLSLQSPDDGDSFIDDWLQASWERLVESSISQQNSFALEPYGEGADCNPGSSRVWMPSRLPTHRVIVRPLAGNVIYDFLNEVEISDAGVFSHFCSMRDSWPAVSAPFDCIALESVEQAVISTKNIVFWAEPL